MRRAAYSTDLRTVMVECDDGLSEQEVESFSAISMLGTNGIVMATLKTGEAVVMKRGDEDDD